MIFFLKKTRCIGANTLVDLSGWENMERGEKCWYNKMCYLYVAGGLALAWQFMVILASSDSSG